MKTCNGAPAERFALGYVEGTLSPEEAERFEEHYFECAVCLEQLESLQAVSAQLAQNPVPITQVANRSVLAWPRWGWTAAAATFLLATGLIGMWFLRAPAGAPANMAKVPAPVQRNETPTPASTEKKTALSQLVDEDPPFFAAMDLRGEIRDAHFVSGMEAYLAGNWNQAVADLQQVPAGDPDRLAAQLYSGSSQMQLGRMNQAASAMKSVADAGDSPQQESALYALAQIALSGSHRADAQRYLRQTIELHGDLESRARLQLRRIALLAAQEPEPKGPVKDR